MIYLGERTRAIDSIRLILEIWNMIVLVTVMVHGGVQVIYLVIHVKVLTVLLPLSVQTA